MYSYTPTQYTEKSVCDRMLVNSLANCEHFLIVHYVATYIRLLHRKHCIRSSILCPNIFGPECLNTVY